MISCGKKKKKSSHYVDQPVKALKLYNNLFVIYFGRTIFASGVFGLLQMVSEPDTRRCTSEDVGLEGVDWRFHIDWRGE